jgi:hypothetical protein
MISSERHEALGVLVWRFSRSRARFFFGAPFIGELGAKPVDDKSRVATECRFASFKSFPLSVALISRLICRDRNDD